MKHINKLIEFRAYTTFKIQHTAYIFKFSFLNFFFLQICILKSSICIKNEVAFSILSMDLRVYRTEKLIARYEVTLQHVPEIDLWIISAIVCILIYYCRKTVVQCNVLYSYNVYMLPLNNIICMYINRHQRYSQMTKELSPHLRWAPFNYA